MEIRRKITGCYLVYPNLCDHFNKKRVFLEDLSKYYTFSNRKVKSDLVMMDTGQVY